MEIAWTESALADMATINKLIAIRVKRAVERFAATAAGNVKRLQGIDPPEYRLRVGDYRARFPTTARRLRFSASAIAPSLTANNQVAAAPSLTWMASRQVEGPRRADSLT